ncbi:hypothetical protein HUJ04_000569 [Dendroctonus ponderosae]|nr:hypothetical protein HUJ04_000569 [Dendroctonus ponderosae]KAH1011141.1 hypothetical protein HUJ04_000569 [Dendroctonus ponderosae]KAH1011142.1 hypothetical protein HUJ04_000569 [Dendroctonus ponderosae]
MGDREAPNSDQDDQNGLAEVENGDDDLGLYLGKLNPLSGYTLFEDGEVLHNIFALFTDTLVFPGFTLPLVMNDYFENRVFKNFIDEHNNVFVLLCAKSPDKGLIEYGVTMEIFETSLRNNMLHIKAKGRQRCERISSSNVENVAGRIRLVTVKILGDPPIKPPLENTQLLALKSKRKWNLNSFDELKSCVKFRRYHAAQFRFANWVYDLNEVTYYTQIILQALTNYGKDLIPNDPERLSYWFVQNYLLKPLERIRILSAKSTLERLKLEVNYLRLDRLICCYNCRYEITYPSKIFAMSKDGLQSNYVNPGGFVYEIITVSCANNIRLAGDASRQFSWFPGYAWTVIECINCNNHIGWQFTSNNLTPKKFFGLAHTGIRIVSAAPALDKQDPTGHTTYAYDYYGLSDSFN